MKRHVVREKGQLWLHRRWKLLILALVSAVTGVYLLSVHESPETPEAHARRLEQIYGIRVSFGDPSTFFAAPYEEPLPNTEWFQVKSAERDAAAVALGAIERSLAQYPLGFVSKLIRAIFICGELRMDGAEAGGTTGPAWIILSAARRLGVEGIEQTSRIGVHHELSSIVYERDPDTATRWAAFAPNGAHFDVRADAMLSRAADKAPPLSSGFLSAYGATNPENDFNVYAERIFTAPAEVRAAAATEPLVRKKLAFVLSVYEALDPRMHALFLQLGVAPR